MLENLTSLKKIIFLFTSKYILSKMLTRKYSTEIISCVDWVLKLFNFSEDAYIHKDNRLNRCVIEFLFNLNK